MCSLYYLCVVPFLIHICVLFSTQELLQNFMSKTLGSSSNMPTQGGFSFVDSAAELADDLIKSLAIDVTVDLDFAFGLNLNPMFNSSASVSDRLPVPFIQLNQFDLSGLVGVNEWSSSLDLGGVQFSITEAKALLSIKATLSSDEPIVITHPSNLTALVQPASGSDGIVFEAGLDVLFPVFLMFDDLGFGARIGFM